MPTGALPHLVAAPMILISHKAIVRFEPDAWIPIFTLDILLAVQNPLA